MVEKLRDEMSSIDCSWLKNEELKQHWKIKMKLSKKLLTGAKI